MCALTHMPEGLGKSVRVYVSLCASVALCQSLNVPPTSTENECGVVLCFRPTRARYSGTWRMAEGAFFGNKTKFLAKCSPSDVRARVMVKRSLFRRDGDWIWGGGHIFSAAMSGGMSGIRVIDDCGFLHLSYATCPSNDVTRACT